MNLKLDWKVFGWDKWVFFFLKMGSKSLRVSFQFCCNKYFLLVEWELFLFLDEKIQWGDIKDKCAQVSWQKYSNEFIESDMTVYSKLADNSIFSK